MAKNVKINGVTYEDVPQVEIPLADNSGNNAVFFDTTGADAADGDVLSGKKYFKGSGQSTGSMPDNGTVTQTISTKAQVVSIAAGKHSGSGTVQIDSTEQAKIVSGNIKSGATILGVGGSSTVVDTSDADATAAHVVSGKTAYVNGSKITGSLNTPTISQDATTKVLSIA